MLSAAQQQMYKNLACNVAKYGGKVGTKFALPAVLIVGWMLKPAMGY